MNAKQIIYNVLKKNRKMQHLESKWDIQDFIFTLFKHTHEEEKDPVPRRETGFVGLWSRDRRV